MNKRNRGTVKPRADLEPEWTMDTVRHPGNPLTYQPVDIRDGLEYGEYKHDRTKLHGPEPTTGQRSKFKSKAEYPPCNPAKYVEATDPYRLAKIKALNARAARTSS